VFAAVLRTGLLGFALAACGGGPRAEPISVGARVSGRITVDSPRLSEGGSAFALYGVELRAGRAYTISTQSGEFDSAVAVYAGRGEIRPGNALARGDDASYLDQNGLVVFRPDRNGAHRIAVITQQPGQQGAFILEVDEGLPGQEVGLLEVVQATLGPGSYRTFTGFWTDRYSFEAQAGQRAFITVRPDAFRMSAYLVDGDGQLVLSSRTISAGEVLEGRLPATGHYTLYVYRFEPVGGTYTVAFNIQ
jgi:hypothetical protein